MKNYMQNLKTETPAILEIDWDRGVIYVHNQKTGETILRIQRLPAPIPAERVSKLLDINFEEKSVSWEPAKE